jgi:hypothetical protein
MARNTASLPMTQPRLYLVRMAVFVILAGFIAFILSRSIERAFMANPGLNGLIVGVLLIGILLAFRQVTRLFREVAWVNALGRDAPVTTTQPELLAPVARLFAGGVRVSTVTLRTVLDSVGLRLDEAREVGRYLTGLLVFLGLLGTFWGLLETVGSVGTVISSMKTGADAALMFDELKSGLAAPLSGMGISFSSSLFGLAGSLVLGFLDLQAGQAQNRFYNELEDWMSEAIVDHQIPDASAHSPEIERLLRKISEAVSERSSSMAIASLAEGIQALVQHMRSEQQMIRDWADAQAGRESEMRKLIEHLSRETHRP